MTTLYLIRHAEAEGNLYRRIHGQYDSLITDNGYRQIAALEKHFADVPIDVVYSSDLFRTMTTARSITVPKHLPLNTRADLRELSMGTWEDRSFAGVDRSDREMMRLFSASSPAFRAPGGESLQEVRTRGAKAILDIAAHHPDQTVAVFAHGTLIRNTLAELTGIPPEDIGKMGHSDNTAVACLEVEDGQARVVYMNDNSHLPPELSTLAQQHWWNKADKERDVNLWFTAPENRQDWAFYQSCREEAWRNLYGQLDRYDGKGFLEEAQRVAKKHPKSLSIAMDRKEPVGLLQLDPERSSREKKGYISFLYLVPALRRKHCGVQLIGKAVSIYRPLGRESLELVCSESNGPALAFYEKYGFHPTGSTPGAYGTLYTMEKYIGYRQPEALS